MTLLVQHWLGVEGMPRRYADYGVLDGFTTLNEISSIGAFLLTLLVTLYLGVHASKMEPRPEDRHDAEIADGAGELGFFPPYSWWPLWCGATLGLCVFGVAMGAWWLFIMGVGLGTLALCGWIYEYYVGDHAH
jgi:hypothetical protein